MRDALEVRLQPCQYLPEIVATDPRTSTLWLATQLRLDKGGLCNILVTCKIRLHQQWSPAAVQPRPCSRDELQQKEKLRRPSQPPGILQRCRQAWALLRPAAPRQLPPGPSCLHPLHPLPLACSQLHLQPCLRTPAAAEPGRLQRGPLGDPPRRPGFPREQLQDPAAPPQQPLWGAGGQCAGLLPQLPGQLHLHLAQLILGCCPPPLGPWGRLAQRLLLPRLRWDLHPAPGLPPAEPGRLHFQAW